jgi:hypothetical protein
MARRKVHSLINDAHLALLRDEPCPPDANYLEYLLAQDHGTAARLWRLYGPKVLGEWIEKSPGTRPTMWWRFDAPRWTPPDHHTDFWYAKQKLLPEPRQRLSGTGTPAWEVMAYMPRWDLGIPEDWAYTCDFDEDDPPTYESQAAYLKRHGLLAPGELKRLTKADFEPELVPCPFEDDDTDEPGALPGCLQTL